MVMRASIPLLCVALLALACGAQEPESAAPSSPTAAPVSTGAASDDDASSQVAARLGDEPITFAELDDWIRNDLFARAWDTESDLFALRSESLERMVTERIVERAAAARNLGVDEFVAAEVDAMGEISEEEVAAFYEEQKDKVPGMTLEELKPRIREFLRRERGTQYVRKLRDETSVTILLEQPRIAMAADGPSRGPDDAAITIIEFSDFQCPFCGRALPVMNELLEKYPDDVRLVYRHLPLDRIHSRARPAAEASACADEQGKFWPFHDLLFANSKALGDDDLRRFAGEVGLDIAAWEQCRAEGRTKQKVQQDFEDAQRAGITSTPTFLVNGILMGGAKPVERFSELIDAELASRTHDEAGPRALPDPGSVYLPPHAPGLP